jgi:hypothetical protein
MLPLFSLLSVIFHLYHTILLNIKIFGRLSAPPRAGFRKAQLASNALLVIWNAP